jgi:hypothetical protein
VNSRELTCTWLVRIADLAGTIIYTLEDRTVRHGSVCLRLDV